MTGSLLSLGAQKQGNCEDQDSFLLHGIKKSVSDCSHLLLTWVAEQSPPVWGDPRSHAKRHLQTRYLLFLLSLVWERGAGRTWAATHALPALFTYIQELLLQESSPHCPASSSRNPHWDGRESHPRDRTACLRRVGRGQSPAPALLLLTFLLSAGTTSMPSPPHRSGHTAQRFSWGAGEVCWAWVTQSTCRLWHRKWRFLRDAAQTSIILERSPWFGKTLAVGLGCHTRMR